MIAAHSSPSHTMNSPTRRLSHAADYRVPRNALSKLAIECARKCDGIAVCYLNVKYAFGKFGARNGKSWSFDSTDSLYFVSTYRTAMWRLSRKDYLQHPLAYKWRLDQPVDFVRLPLAMSFVFQWIWNAANEWLRYLKPYVSLEHGRTSSIAFIFDSEWHWWYHTMW